MEFRVGTLGCETNRAEEFNVHVLNMLTRMDFFQVHHRLNANPRLSIA
ncbi:hypothetical protein SP21_5 [Salmonella phage 21]|nr:hypothetical protein SP21_5 [Salmonella phage 21]